MRLLDRYLFRELIVPLGYCLSGFLLLWITSSLINDLNGFQEKKLTPLDIGEFYLVQSPEFLALGLPIALLLALLYTVTNLARHNELTAMRAAGISLWRLCLPYLFVGLISSAALFVLNEWFVPDSAARTEQIRNRHQPRATNALGKDKISNLEFENARDHRTWHVALYDTRTAEMLKPIVNSTLPDGSWSTLKAERGARVRGVWTFYDVWEFKQTDPNLPMVPSLRTNVLQKPNFSETPEEIRSEIKISTVINTISLSGTKKADIPIAEILKYLRLHPHPKQAALLYTKLQGRLAAPFTCLVVILIAIPFGAASGRRNVFVGVASSITICFAFFVLQQLCLALGAGGHVPPWVAGWFPNIGFGIAGLWLTLRVR